MFDKKDFTIGVIFGCLLTILGAYVQSSLFEKYDKQKTINQLSISTCTILNSRYIRAKNVIASSSSSVFESRWDEYVSHGIYDWNENFGLFKHFIKAKFPTMENDFNLLGKKFIELHSHLLVIRRLQESKSSVSQNTLNETSKKAEEKCSEIEPLIRKFENELLHFE